MKYNQLKWAILLLPAFSVGLWEYIRHTILEPYLSMSFGNWLSALIVFLPTLYLWNRLFKRLECIQKTLQEERAEKAVLQNREQLAKELHDGIAQSLFFLSIKFNSLGKRHSLHDDPSFASLHQTLRRVNEDTRQAIRNLRWAEHEEHVFFTSSLTGFFEQVEQEHGVHIQSDWEIGEEYLTAKEKIELLACIKEAVINSVKHAGVREVKICGKRLKKGWTCSVQDSGKGFGALPASDGYGLHILRDRTDSMGWSLKLESGEKGTLIMIQKEAG